MKQGLASTGGRDIVVGREFVEFSFVPRSRGVLRAEVGRGLGKPR